MSPIQTIMKGVAQEYDYPKDVASGESCDSSFKITTPETVNKIDDTIETSIKHKHL